MHYLLAQAAVAAPAVSNDIDIWKLIGNGSPAAIVAAAAIYLAPKIMAHFRETVMDFKGIIEAIRADAKGDRETFSKAIDRNTDALLEHTKQLASIGTSIQMMNKA